tara:strand:- start:14 stop:460 length:447 start_codon:yes stop_codon:yes gene_type:complete
MSRGEKRRKRRRDRKQARRDTKQLRRDSRRQARLDRKATKQNARTARVESRTARKSAAYEAGIDPNAWMGDTLSGLGQAAGNVISSKFEQDRLATQDLYAAQLADRDKDNPFAQTAMGMSRRDDTQPGNNNLLLYAGVGLLAFMMLKK